MELSSIINRDNESSFEVSELAFVVEEYVYRRRGRKVTVDVLSPFRTPFGFMAPDYKDQILKLNKAFIIAQTWFKEGNL